MRMELQGTRCDPPSGLACDHYGVRSGKLGMQLSDMIVVDGVWARLRVSNKSQLLKELSHRASAILNIEEAAIHGALIERENLGSTGVGSGIALPHARLPGLQQCVGMVITLERPIDFRSIDDRPVDLVGLLLLPEAEKANANVALACLARRLREPKVADRLRASKTQLELYDELCGKTQESNI
jgi:PTS system nitrogen regulatory IIA component